MINLASPFKFHKVQRKKEEDKWSCLKGVLVDTAQYKDHVTQANSKPVVKEYIKQVMRKDYLYKPTDDSEKSLITDPSNSQFLNKLRHKSDTNDS